MTRAEATREAQKLADTEMVAMVVVDEGIHAAEDAPLPSYGYCRADSKALRYPHGRVVDIIHPGDAAGRRN